LKQLISYFFFLLLCGILFLPPFYLPFLEKKLGWQFGELGGFSVKQDKPILTWNNWIKGKYQKQYNNFLNDKTEVKRIMVRTRNKWDYDVFGTLGNKEVLLGKENMLFDQSYCNSRNGLDFKGRDWIAEQLAKLKVIVEYLKTHDTHFLIVVPPAKARVFPDLLPDSQRNFPRDSTNWETFNQLFSEFQIPFLDFHFLLNYEEKNNLSVYPQTGLHWNYLGAALTLDSMLQVLERQDSIAFPNIIWNTPIPINDNFEDTDLELLRSINLSEGFPQYPMPYPILHFSEIPKTKSIVIGDSYYKILFRKGYHEKVFQKKSPFWYYYNRQLFKKKDSEKWFDHNPKKVLPQLEATDVVILSCSEINLVKFGFGFIEAIHKEVLIKTENK